MAKFFESFIANIGSLVSGIRVTDVIDVLIIAVVIFAILQFIHKTRAQQLARGIIWLVVFSLVAGAVHLHAVSWLLSNILQIGLLALIIIFQPELRRALELLGRGRLGLRFVGVDKASATESADAIARAVDHMSATKTGALIIIERETLLNDIAETGTIIDAKITQELIENIFYEGSPLHDGALIIRGDRVHAAGCVLPLTENQTLSRDLGTRHRAGIGVSEVSDAIAVIVSEETGIISTAVDGKLSRFLDLKSVEKLLLSHYMNSDRKSAGFLGVLLPRRKEAEHDEA